MPVGVSYLSFLSSLRSSCAPDGAAWGVPTTKLAVSFLTATATSFQSSARAKTARPSPAPKPSAPNSLSTNPAVAPKGPATPEDDRPAPKQVVEISPLPNPLPSPQPSSQFPPQLPPQPPPEPPSRPLPQPSSNRLPRPTPNPTTRLLSQPKASAQGQQISISLSEPGSKSVHEYGSTVPRPVQSLGNNLITANPFSEFVIGSQTVQPGGPEITVAGQPTSLAPAANHIVIGGSTIIVIPTNRRILRPLTIGGNAINANSASQFIIGSKTLEPGSPAIIVSGTPISLDQSASDIVIAGTTTPLTALPTPSGPAIVIAGKTIFPNSVSAYIIGSQTLIPGAPAITISGTPISLAPSASKVVIGGATIPLSAAPTPIAPALTIAGKTIFPNSASEYVIGSQTLIPGAPEITVSGTVLSLSPSPLALVIDSKIIPLASPTVASILTIGGHTITPDAASRYIVDGQTLIPGGSAITISGTRISLAPMATNVEIGSSTLGLGGLIISGIGALPTEHASATAPEAYRGEATRTRRVGVGAGMLGVGIGLVVWMGL
ncbi:hypothetical protein MMC22_000592 [Lobaria immixta]|nr:hypothetical protein [Lobaria immixta]